jgi:hypothetical protein
MLPTMRRKWLTTMLAALTLAMVATQFARAQGAASSDKPAEPVAAEPAAA